MTLSPQAMKLECTNIVHAAGNGGRANYRVTEADQAVWDRTLRLKNYKLVLNRGLARLVASKI